MRQLTESEASVETISQEEITAMARTLLRHYAGHAQDIAGQFSHEHDAMGDTARAEAWNRVAEELKKTGPARTVS